MLIHPIYYTDTGRWEHGKLKAKSLRELAAKLPEGTQIAQYYPDGYGNIVKPRTTAAAAKISLNDAQRFQMAPAKAPAPREYKVPAIPHVPPFKEPEFPKTPEIAAAPPEAAVQDSGEQGLFRNPVPRYQPKRNLTEDEPIVELEPASFKPMLQRKPKPAHPNSRAGKTSGVWNAMRDEQLRMLVADEAKYSAKQIAEKMGCTRNAIIGRCHRLKFQLQHDNNRRRAVIRAKHIQEHKRS